MRQNKYGLWLPDRDICFESWLDNPEPGHVAGLYQSHLIKEVLRYCRVRRVAVDIGAHVGLITLQLAPTFRRVVAFEPWHENVACFRKNVTQENVKLGEYAIGAVDEARLLRIIPHCSGGNFIEDMSCDHPLAGEAVRVPVRPLDSFKLAKVDLIKIDVQGCELEVVQGGEETIKRNRPIILIEQAENWPFAEYKRDFEWNAAVKMLQRWGMRLARHKTKDAILDWEPCT